MAAALRRLGYTVTLLTNATQEQMEQAVGDLGAALSGDPKASGLFYYAGHGVQFQGSNYIIPADAQIQAETQLKYRCLSMDFVLDTLSRARNAFSLIILDACRDNPFSGFRSASRGLAVVGTQPPGSVIVYATGAGSVAADGDGRNGVFTEAFLKNLERPGVEINDLLDAVGQEVQERTRGAQSPAVYKQFFGSYYLAGAAGAAKAAPAATTEPVSATRSGAGQTGELYLTTDPSGAEVSLDGDRRGVSPLLIREVPVGRRLRVEARIGNRVGSSEVTLDKAGLQDLNLVLQAEKGNLVIISTERTVRVALDGRPLGELGSGLFRDVEAGGHTLELTGSGVYWKGEVTVAANKTADVRAEPYAVGEIVYDIPAGAEASVAGNGTSQTVRSSGRLVNVPPGRYEVVASGSEYDTVRLTVDLAQGQAYELKPYRTGTLVVESTPSGAAVTVGGAYRGTTPLTLADVPAGAASVEVRLSGYGSQGRDVVVAGGRSSTVSVGMVRSLMSRTLTDVQGDTSPSFIDITSTRVSQVQAGLMEIEFTVAGTIPLEPLHSYGNVVFKVWVDSTSATTFPAVGGGSAEYVLQIWYLSQNGTWNGNVVDCAANRFIVSVFKVGISGNTAKGSIPLSLIGRPASFRYSYESFTDTQGHDGDSNAAMDEILLYYE